MEYLIGLILALLGGLFYTNTKRKSAEALLENNDVTKKVNAKDHDIELKRAQLEFEAAKRAAIESKSKLKESSGDDVSQKDLEDFLNKPSDR